MDLSKFFHLQPPAPVATPVVARLFEYLKSQINREDLVSDIWERYTRGELTAAYLALEHFIVVNKPLIVKRILTRDQLRSEINQNFTITDLPPELQVLFLPYPTYLEVFFNLATKPLIDNFTLAKGMLAYQELTKQVVGTEALRLDAKASEQQNAYSLYNLFRKIYEEVVKISGGQVAQSLVRQAYQSVEQVYGPEWLARFFSFLPEGLLPTERLAYLSREELATKVAEATAAQREQLTATQNLNLQIQEQNKTLEDSKKAMLNLLEDARSLENQLKEEKASVEQRIAERTAELQSERAKLRASIEALLKAFVMVDLENHIVLKNQNLTDLLGQPDGDWTMDKIQSRLGGSYDLTSAIAYCLQSKQRLISDTVAWSNRFLEIRISPVFGDKENSTIIGTLIIIGDVTEEKIIQRSRDEFFSIASHELRTPLTAIRGNTDLILQFFGDKITDPQFKEMIEDIHASSIRLIGIVNDFLNMSRLEMGKAEFKKEQIDVNGLIADTLKEYQASGIQKQLELKQLKAKPKLPMVLGDPDRLRQVLVNLLGNAIKFTDKGGVTISAVKTNDGVQVEVTDSGGGISPQNQTLLFHKFQQAGDNLLTRDASKGTGLGLYISRLMMEGMGGKIWLEKSEVGKGSTFAFSLPLAAKLPD